jgi:single-strand DNA-binding protein
MDNTLTLCGNATSDPKVRYTEKGLCVVTFDIAVNRNYTDGQGQKQTKVMFCEVQIWRQLAENVAESIHRGNRVIATGMLDLNSWEADDGTRRSKLRMACQDIGLSLLFGTGTFTKIDRRQTADNTAAIEQAEAAAGDPSAAAPPRADGEGGEEPF